MAPKPKILITGVSGLLGNNLAYFLKDQYYLFGLYHNHPFHQRGITTASCNLSDAGSCQRIIDAFGPDIIVHCASLTDIDACEKDPEAAYRINAEGTKQIVDHVMGTGAKLIYISTDAVYDGDIGYFSEADPSGPKNHYGSSKLAGEQAVLRCDNSLILRTNIFGWNVQHKESLGEWILGSLSNGKPIKGFSDAYFSTIYTMELARIIDMALQRDLSGIYNCGSIDSCSKYDFAKKIAHRFGYDPALVEPITIDAFGFCAERGHNLSLDSRKLSSALCYNLPTVDYCIDSFYRDYCLGVRERIRSLMPADSGTGRFISYGRQTIDETDIDAVAAILRSDWITQGPSVTRFERELAQRCGAEYAVAVNSGTSALHIAAMAAGIQPGDSVITSPITFVASANCVVYCGGKPKFVDIDARTYTLDPIRLEKSMSDAVSGVIPVHFAGQSCDMAAISDVVERARRKYGKKIWIIEDASHALGSFFRGKPVGACTYSDMAVMSFHPVKHITTGEGGAVLTNDPAIYNALKRFRSHGITSTPTEFQYRDQAADSDPGVEPGAVNPWYYEQIDLGYNYRITDFQCALGRSQLNKIDQFIRRRREIVEYYNHAFKGIESIQTPFEHSDGIGNFHLYVLKFDFDRIGISRGRLMRRLKERGIQTQVHYIPVHTQPFYQNLYGTRWGDFPRAEAYYRRCLSIPLYPAMTDGDVDTVIREIRMIAEIS